MTAGLQIVAVQGVGEIDESTDLVAEIAPLLGQLAWPDGTDVQSSLAPLIASQTASRELALARLIIRLRRPWDCSTGHCHGP